MSRIAVNQMKRFAKFLGAVALLVCISRIACADDVTINWNNNSSTLLRDAAGNPLTEGTAGVNADSGADLVQLGYFSAADASNNFAGTWIPITGFGAAPNTSIGDSASPNASIDRNGRIAFNTFFTIGSNVVQVYAPIAQSAGAYQDQSSVTITENPGATPPNGKVMSIRFYDVSTGQYNTVSSDSWLWTTPDINNPSTSASFLMGSSTLEFESVSVFGLMGTEFKTVLPIPEPSTLALLSLALLPFLRRRKA